MAGKNKGWVRIARSVRDNWVWQDKPFAKGQAWIDLILRANHEDKSILIRGQLVTVRAGEMITSLRKLASDWGWNVKTVNHFISALERDGMVHTTRTSNWTSITLVNWGNFQIPGYTERNTERNSTGYTEGYTERIQTKNKTNKQYNNARARDARNMIGQFQLAPGMRNDYSSMIADLERANEERNRQERLSSGSWEDGYDEYEEEA